ncbi:MAG: hypothetical protein M1816_000792 [Peltula sp. TS41687]|nr:MAG: hypothetical protein M1816_000792 [Peltula sp. TS41687]
MPIRNPFRRTGAPSGIISPPDENGRPYDENPGRTTSALSIKSSRSREEPDGYKMSGMGPLACLHDVQNLLDDAGVIVVVKEDGVYLPPSPPPEKTGFWSRSHSSTTSSNHRSMLSENGPFNISRESFESYRRSFDISARSPVPQSDAIPSRHSVDSRSARLPTPRRHTDQPPPAEEEEEIFEEVALSDGLKPKKRTLFSRFGDSSDANSSSAPSGSSHHHGFSFTGRKRGLSGQGAELRDIPRPVSSGASEIKVGT